MSVSETLPPQSGVSPDTEAELAELLRGGGDAWAVQGGNTRGVRCDAKTLSTASMSGVTLYEPGALTLVARAGTPVSEIEETLAQENQRLAFEPMDHRQLLGTSGTPTIGGVFAANVSGPRRMTVGAARDFLLGVRFVDGKGDVVKNGGRVMKNVTGYDLVKLMAGSFGTLGVLTEVSLKVLPRPETEATLVLNGLSDTEAVQAMAQAMGSPFEVTGAAHDPASSKTYLRIEGFEQSVTYRAGRLRDLLAEKAGEAEIEEAEASAETWRALRDVTAFAGKQGNVWSLSCKPSDAPAIAERSGAQSVLYDWGGGRLWCLTSAGHDVRAAVGAFAGHATLVRADADTFNRLGRFHPEAPGVAQLAAALRHRFDPHSRLNPGLMARAT